MEAASREVMQGYLSMERDDVILYCPRISTYGRIATMVAEECGASWSIMPTDPRAKEALARQAFGKSPAAIVAHTELYESVAICQLIATRSTTASFS